ncbi:GNAT family N-acetyltransferase, partial [bacterium M00.F.Ca.ET.180.01.1.1]
MRQQATDFLLRPGTIDDVEVIYAALLRLSTHIGAHQEIKSTAD